MITTASVRGCEKLFRAFAVAHGFLPALSAHGSREEHVSFQPAHDEWTGEPHDGQNCTQARVCELQGGGGGAERAHLVARVPVDDASRLGEQRRVEQLERAHRRPRLRKHQLRALARRRGRRAQDPIYFFLRNIAHVEGKVRVALDVGDDRLDICVRAEVGRGQRGGERRLLLVQTEEDDRCAPEAGRLERLDVGRGELAFALALGEERLGAQEGPDVACGQAGEGLPERGGTRGGRCGGVDERLAVVEYEPAR